MPMSGVHPQQDLTGEWVEAGAVSGHKSSAVKGADSGAAAVAAPSPGKPVCCSATGQTDGPSAHDPVRRTPTDRMWPVR
jgi:hypothetical protein